MARRQDDLSDGAAPSSTTANTPQKIAKVGPKAGNAGTRSGSDDAADHIPGPQSRPGTDPKNPGDFGHR